ncbi:MAG: YicC family protein [Burkholderiales bacterium]|nr:YicC family protein [Burkholderiales bacterium]
MTGYGAATRDAPCGAVAIEVRSVNSRYLDVSVRMHDDLRSLEASLREQVTSVASRGKVEVRVAVGREAGIGGLSAINVNQDGLRRLAEAAATVKRHAPDAAPLSVAEILHWPGVIEQADVSAETVRSAVFDACAAALAEFRAARGREGAKMKEMILARVAGIEAQARLVEPLLPRIVADHQSKLAARLRDALGSADDERVRQEIALFGIKVDVAEELTRLAAHLGEVRRVLERGGACGKRLDFLMQELNREANTLGSKSVSTEVSAAAMEMKVLIEQMREQVQNVE